MRRKPPARAAREPTIALINIVFLMLVFFMVAGTLAVPPDRDLSLVKTSDLEGREPADTLVIAPDGTLRFRGQPVGEATEVLDRLTGEAGLARLLPDRDAPAAKVLSVARALRNGGAERVVIVTEKALQ